MPASSQIKDSSTRELKDSRTQELKKNQQSRAEVRIAQHSSVLEYSSA